jgi:segregation and condensation protein B
LSEQATAPTPAVPEKEELDKEVTARIEAALYASGRPLDSDQLARAGRITSQRKAVALAREIAAAVNENLKSVEVVEYPGPRFAMQLKAEYSPLARKFATKPLLSKAALRTLSFIAYFQPISSSELALRRTTAVYGHLRELEGVGFVLGERSGRTRMFRTTSRFSDYFGLSLDPSVMKRQLEGKNLTLR